MKIKLFVLLTVLTLDYLSQEPLKAQSYRFNFDHIQYSEISGNFLTLNEAFDDTLFTSIPIGFQFRFAGRSWTKLHIHSDGQIFFGDDPANLDTLRAIIPFGSDLYGDYFSHTPAISYESGGCAGAVVMKIQFKECSLKGGGPDDYVNFQVWLYESSGTIEYHYGPGMATSAPACFGGNSGPQSGIRISVPANDKILYSCQLTSYAFAPDTSMSPLPLYLEGIPDENMVYNFEPLLTTGIATADAAPINFIIYYNQADQSLHLEPLENPGESIYIQLADVSGRVWIARLLETKRNENHSMTIPVSMLTQGTYVLTVNTSKSRKAFRFIKTGQ